MSVLRRHTTTTCNIVQIKHEKRIIMVKNHFYHPELVDVIFSFSNCSYEKVISIIQPVKVVFHSFPTSSENTQKCNFLLDDLVYLLLIINL